MLQRQRSTYIDLFVVVLSFLFVCGAIMKAGLVNDSTLFPFKMINKTNFIHVPMKATQTNNFVAYV